MKLSHRISNLILPAIGIVLVAIGVAIAAAAVAQLGLAWAILLCLAIGVGLVVLHDRHFRDDWGFTFSVLFVPILIGLGLGIVCAGLWRAFS